MRALKQIVLCFVVLFVPCSTLEAQDTEKQLKDERPVPNAISLLGTKLYSPKPSDALLKKLAAKREAYEKDPTADNLIWFGRFTAYAGNYNEAIEIFSEGIKKFPEDARMLRHRGHRYITTRKFKDAISELTQAAKMIEGKKNEVEPDGMPNAQNIPVSTLHGNIWYHLGLAHYLVDNKAKAIPCFQKCIEVSTNDDNLVSATHWLYMMHRELRQEERAKECLEPIERDLKIIENFSYHRCCMFYKGLISMDELRSNTERSPAGDSIAYAVANWHLYSKGPTDQIGWKLCQEMVDSNRWASFGVIAAESKLAQRRKSVENR